MFYTVYQITNQINGRTYIGKHMTEDLNDGYMGSGKLLLQAIKKYGSANFSKEICFVFDNEYDMNQKEKELVVVSRATYNLCEGGKGDFSYINRLGIAKFKGRNHTDETKLKISRFRKGKTHYIPTAEYKARMSAIMKEKHKQSPGFNKAGVVQR
jgi:hypothetical protein